MTNIIEAYCIAHGDWDETMRIFNNNTSDDGEYDINKLIETYINGNTHIQLRPMASLSGDVAKRLMDLPHVPPLLEVVSPNDGVHLLTETNIVAIDETIPNKDAQNTTSMLLKAGWTVGYVEETYLHIVKLHESGLLNHLCLHFAKNEYACTMLSELCAKLLLTKGGLDTVRLVNSVIHTSKPIFAVPGKNKSFTNALIKGGAAYLCDSIRDLKEPIRWVPSYTVEDELKLSTTMGRGNQHIFTDYDGGGTGMYDVPRNVFTEIVERR